MRETAVPLPIGHYSHMLVDAAHRHLFLTSGPGSSNILVTDYSGQTVATIPNEPGATRLALSSDGSTVYTALAGGDAVSAISTSSLAETARYPTGTGTDPTYLAYTSGKIWLGYGTAGQGGLGSIDPGTSPATVILNAAPGNWYSAPILAATPGGELVAGQPGLSPSELASYDVSSGTATVLAPQQSMYPAGNLSSFQITPDGTDVVTASGYPYYQQVLRVSDLSVAGTYPTTNYPNCVSIASDGTVAAGTEANNEIFVFAPGGSTPLNTYNFGSNWLANDGAALTPDGSILFAVTLVGGRTGAPTLNIIPNPEQPRRRPDQHGRDLLARNAADRPDHLLQGHRDRLRRQRCDDPDREGRVHLRHWWRELLPQRQHTLPGLHQRTSSGSGVFSATQCTLSGTGTSVSCTVYYGTSAGVPMSGQTITASYGGDSTHQESTGSTMLT